METTMKDAAKTSLQKQNGSGNKKMDLFDKIEKQKPGFSLALPKDFDADRFTRIALTAIRGNVKLQKCEPTSVLGALMLCAQLGLEPNSPLHEASIIPYGDKATFQIEYRGLLKLVWNSGLIAYIDYDKVCKNDVFEYTKGFNPTFIHKPSMGEDRGEAYAYYAIAELKDGGKVFVIRSKDDIKKHAARFSKAYGDRYKDSPWQTDFDSMATKTVLKELADKKLPKRTTNEALLFAKAIAKDDHVNNLPESLTDTERRLDIDDIETEDADYSEVNDSDDNNNKTEPASENKPEGPFNPEELQKPSYWLNKAREECKTSKDFIAWHKKNKANIDQFTGDDFKMLMIGLENLEKALSSKK